jgi:glyoxylase-like metal-dependent hydrolase (beta-lactamase superfamily II)
MSSFDYVSFSHMHFDHVGAVGELKTATFLTARSEYEAAFADSVTVPLFNPTYYSAIQSSERIILDGEHDVFGDGRVRIVPAAGHTPGHQVLFLDFEETGPVLIAGDLYFFEESRDLRRVPLFNVDAEETRRSMDRIEALVAETGAEVWIEHDAQRFDTQQKSPIPFR